MHRDPDPQPEHTARTALLVPVQLKREVAKGLEHILESKGFRGSKRAQLLLRYVIENGLAGQTDRLKERTIGVELFGRDADYDTGQDAIVRVAANDVRKRLAEYYESAPASTVRISLPAGSYVPEFQVIEHPPATEAPHARTIRKRRIRLTAAALFAGVVTLFFFYGLHRAAGTDVAGDFWRPVLKSERPVLICVAQPMAYRVLSESEERFSDEDLRAPAGADDSNSGTIPRNQLIPMADAFIGIGDGAALGHLASLFGARGKAWQLRVGKDASSADLRSGPAVLIGAYTNPWTRNLTRNLRFVFEPQSIIRDRWQGRVWNIPDKTQDWKTPEDYGMISRVLRAETGEPVVVVAGLTNAGTRAAGEFVTSAKLLNDAVKKLPAGWTNKNLQFIIHTKLIGKTPGPPEVVATHVW